MRTPFGFVTTHQLSTFDAHTPEMVEASRSDQLYHLTDAIATATRDPKVVEKINLLKMYPFALHNFKCAANSSLFRRDMLCADHREGVVRRQ